VVEKAKNVMVAPERDDICVLICLTIRHMNPKVRLVASVREEENIKLLYAAGADVVVSPSASGGRLMGAAAFHPAIVDFMQDLLAYGSGVDMTEHVVTAAEAGKRIHDLPAKEGCFALGLARGKERWPFPQVSDLQLEAGDVVIYLAAPTKS
jgi:voltage-gated potassium channel